MGLGHVDFGEEVARVLDVEDCADADGPEVAHEEGFLPRLDRVGHDFVHEHHGGDAAEEQDEEAQGKQASVGDACDVGLVEFVPGEDGADVHEAAEVEEHVDAAVDFVVALECFLEVAAVPVQGRAGTEAG